jgi:hypothetical protein
MNRLQPLRAAQASKKRCPQGLESVRENRKKQHATLPRKTFPREVVNTEISPLRFASVEMTKGRVALPRRVVAGQRAFFINVGWAEGPLVTPSKNISMKGPRNCRSLRYASLRSG